MEINNIEDYQSFKELQIVSDGTAFNTKILLDGKIVRYVTDLVFLISVDRAACIRLKIAMPNEQDAVVYNEEYNLFKQGDCWVYEKLNDKHHTAEMAEKGIALSTV